MGLTLRLPRFVRQDLLFVCLAQSLQLYWINSKSCTVFSTQYGLELVMCKKIPILLISRFNEEKNDFHLGLQYPTCGQKQTSTSISDLRYVVKLSYKLKVKSKGYFS